MTNEEHEHSQSESSSGSGAGSTGPKAKKAKASSRSKKGVEEKLDEVADRFSDTMSEGVKRMEEAFDRGMDAIRNNPNISGEKVRGFFTSSTGGAVLIVLGFVWFFYAVGLLDNPIFPILVIILGFYLMQRYKQS